MPNIAYNKIEEYNKLVMSNRRLVYSLQKSNEFPLARFNINIQPLISESNEYQKLSDWAGGDENAWYLMSKIHEFERDWIFSPKIVRGTELMSESKKDKFLLDISDCFERETLNIHPLEFFESSLKKKYFEGKINQHSMRNSNIGYMKVPLSKINIPNSHELALSLFDNDIYVVQ